MAKKTIPKVSLKKLNKNNEKKRVGTGDGGLLTKKTIAVRK